ncbi:MAG: choice-of-anchor L domain-containing protein [Saprospiraceae bacterium]|nr:choice-of-anchor L domain-containing protein [Saprospiraceae bacterium]
MLPTITLKQIGFRFLFMLFGAPLFCQQAIQFEEVLLTEIESYAPAAKKNQLVVKMAYGTSSVSNPALLKKLQGKKVEAIDYYFTDFPKGQSFDALHSARLTKLTALIPNLWKRKFFISWKAYRQTSCETEAEAKQLFHGFVITYSAGDPLAFLSPTNRAILDSVETEVSLENPNSTEDITQFLQGEGVKITNLEINDTTKLTKPYLYFKEEEGVIGIFEGLMLTTGLAANAVGPNDKANKSFVGSKKAVTDPEILSLFPKSKKLFDPCILEFDIQIDADTLVFNYVFASEEFPEYLTYHDVFGFFISGKGIADAKDIKLSPEAFERLSAELEFPDAVLSELKKISEKPYINRRGYVGVFRQKFGKKAGEFLKAIDPYIVDIKNLAVLPNGEEVSVGNINHKKNAHLYRPNTLEHDPKVFKAWQYDGFSVPLQAKVQVTPNQTYHLIMAIADQKDASLDSAIFISGTGINGKKK